MKRSDFLPWICLWFTATLAGSVYGAGVAQVTVQFVNPAKFTDFTIRGRTADQTAEIFASKVRDELTPVLKQKYPGSTLVLRFTDIDLAGRTTPTSNIRVTRTAHPSRMSFAFQLTDTSGKVLANGTTRVTDSSSLSSGKYDPRRSELFYYERRALNRWLRTLSVQK